MLNVVMICPRCFGSGISDRAGKPIDPCPVCNGTGKIDVPEIVDDKPIQDNLDLIKIELDWIKKKIKKILNKLELPEE